MLSLSLLLEVDEFSRQTREPYLVRLARLSQQQHVVIAVAKLIEFLLVHFLNSSTLDEQEARNLPGSAYFLAIVDSRHIDSSEG